MSHSYFTLKATIFSFCCLWIVTFMSPHNTFAYSSNCLTSEEQKLYTLINEDRIANNLNEIPLSTSLTLVAQTHARDLQQNPSIVNDYCNMHSWSNQGEWTACCYTSDHAKAKCMWDKPKELSPYTGYGFELSYRNSERATALDALKTWKKSYEHYAVIVNKKNWEHNEWNALGVGIYGQHAVLWFGIEQDLKGSPTYCVNK